MGRLTKEQQRIGAFLFPERGYWRPRTRADCAAVPRPCPYVACHHHLYLDITRTGGLLLSWPLLEPWDIPESCALDVVDHNPDGLTLEQLGQLHGVTRERVRQIESVALTRLRGFVDPAESVLVADRRPPTTSRYTPHQSPLERWGERRGGMPKRDRALVVAAFIAELDEEMERLAETRERYKAEFGRLVEAKRGAGPRARTGPAPQKPRRQSGLATAVARALADAREPQKAKEIAKTVGSTYPRVHAALTWLRRHGRARRVDRGLYVATTKETEETDGND